MMIYGDLRSTTGRAPPADRQPITGKAWRRSLAAAQLHRGPATVQFGREFHGRCARRWANTMKPPLWPYPDEELAAGIRQRVLPGRLIIAHPDLIVYLALGLTRATTSSGRGNWLD